VLYVCGDEACAQRVRELGAQRGLTAGKGGLRVETLTTIKAQALEAWAARTLSVSTGAQVQSAG